MASDRIVVRNDGTHYYLGNKEVTEKVYRKWYPEIKPSESVDSPCSLVPFKPMLSDALAVNPKQIKEVMERNRQHGLHVEYVEDGRPKITSKDQFIKLGALDGYVHKGY